MAEVTREFLRKLSEWSADGVPVSSFYLDVDGRRFPRRQDYALRAEQLAHDLRERAAALGDRPARRSVEDDVRRFLEFVGGLDRGATRGVAVFSSSSAGLWEEVRVPRPVSSRATLSRHPYVLPLEALVETYQSFCTCLVDREKARVFLSRMGQIQEETDVLDEVPGQHDQGGWSQARYQRHIEEHVDRHFKHVAAVLQRFHRFRGFDHLILAGTDEVLAAFESVLHDYLRRKVIARVALSMAAGPQQVLERSVEIEERLEAEQERGVVERLRAGVASGRGAVSGVAGVLGALGEGRVDTLVVPVGLATPGQRCTACGRLSLGGRRCPVCRGHLEEVEDVVDHAVAAALQQGARVEALTTLDEERGSLPAELGALLRF